MSRLTRIQRRPTCIIYNPTVGTMLQLIPQLFTLAHEEYYTQTVLAISMSH